MQNPSFDKKTLLLAILAVLADVWFAFRFGLSLETLQFVVLSGLLVWASAEDLRSRTIPNSCVLAAASVRLACLATGVVSGEYGLAECGYYVISGLGIGFALVMFGIAYEQISGREGMGGGDVKLYAAAGLYAGFEGALCVVFLSCVFAFAAAVLSRPSRGDGEGLSRTLPFGPAISAALIIVLLGAPA